MDFENIVFSKNNKTALIAVGRPKAYNALNKQVIDELDHAIGAIFCGSNNPCSYNWE